MSPMRTLPTAATRDLLGSVKMIDVAVQRCRSGIASTATVHIAGTAAFELQNWNLNNSLLAATVGHDKDLINRRRRGGTTFLTKRLTLLWSRDSKLL